MKPTGAEHFPSEEFAKHVELKWVNLNMKWITVKWKLPVSVKEAGKIIRSGSKTELSDFYDKILELNPDLKKIKWRKSNSHKYCISLGVLSRFNLDDIEFFSDRDVDIVLYNVAMKSLKNLVDERAGILSQWVMSPRTFSRVSAQLNIKYDDLIVKK